MKNLRKLRIILLLSLFALFLTSCNKREEGNSIKIGINQFMEHPALDDAREGFIDGLDTYGIKADIIYLNAQGDISNSLSIAQKLKEDNVDLVYAIATPAAQASKNIIKDKPILFSAVTDPIAAGLNPGENITGTSDMADIKSQLELFSKLDKGINKIGIIYNTSEANSIAQIDEVKKYSKELNLEINLLGINNVNELSQSLDSLIRKVDALYVLSDNMVASAVGLVSNKLLENNMISISAEESQVKGGILLTNGISYYELGSITAEMANDILTNKKDVKDMSVKYGEEKMIKINKKTFEKLNIKKDNPILKDAVFIE